MCTLSIIPLVGALGRRAGYRVVMNRDEQHSRATATPPAVRAVDGRHACWPTDPVGGGTWFATTSHGLTLGLLNVNLGKHEPPSSGVRTRGEIVPKLAGFSSAAAAAAELRHSDLRRYRPFRLVVIDREKVVDLRWDRCRLSESPRAMGTACFVSSGLGDHVVEPRLMLFDSIFSGETATPHMQDMFHRHSWPRHEHLSVMMSREGARTTCVTTVETRYSDESEPSVMMHHSDDAGESVVELSGLVAAAC